MSLINDALKKAQHQRTGDPGDLPPMPGASRGAGNAGRGSSLPPKTLAAIVGGIAAVVIVAVVVTLVLVTRTPAPRAVVAQQPAVKRESPPAAAAPSPVIVAPALPAPKIEIAVQKPAVAEPVRIAVAAPAPAASSVIATPPPLPPAAAKGTQDIRILTLIDALRVTGIRASGTESKVLMNDRVYRVNDMVDYTLGIRLTRVSAEGLTFVDASGTAYVKNF
ncbi:MAG: hypothetical protein JWM88_1634 [Verrucomicrobia bacterium]|nr:hypothetical protein [Verrucomicrobiota bacterium]